jgi:hypothetical protein
VVSKSGRRCALASYSNLHAFCRPTKLTPDFYDRSKQDGVCKKTIDRLRAVESITWFPGGEGKKFSFKKQFAEADFLVSAFLCVEGGDVVKMVSRFP